MLTKLLFGNKLRKKYQPTELEYKYYGIRELHVNSSGIRAKGFKVVNASYTSNIKYNKLLIDFYRDTFIGIPLLEKRNGNPFQCYLQFSLCNKVTDPISDSILHRGCVKFMFNNENDLVNLLNFISSHCKTESYVKKNVKSIQEFRDYQEMKKFISEG